MLCTSVSKNYIIYVYMLCVCVFVLKYLVMLDNYSIIHNCFHTFFITHPNFLFFFFKIANRLSEYCELYGNRIQYSNGHIEDILKTCALFIAMRVSKQVLYMRILANYQMFYCCKRVPSSFFSPLY